MHDIHACNVYTWEQGNQTFTVLQNFPHGAGHRGRSGVADVVSLVWVVSPGGLPSGVRWARLEGNGHRRKGAGMLVKL